MTHVFALPDAAAAKADPALIADDERFFARLAASQERSLADLAERLDAARRAPGGSGQAALDRDQEVHRLSARLRLLQRFGLDLCLGRMVPADGSETTYVGRVGLTNGSGGRLLLDWRSPAAKPFFAATHADPVGLTSRRRYRWSDGRITDYWDEVYDADAYDGHAALDDQSAFVAGLGRSRTSRMQDVLATIAADQDAIIRAGSRGALVVDGGPGTGKTVVALHRTAYLLHADPRLGRRRGGVLFVGPHRPYLAYVADVLPSLGEDGVRTCTLPDLLGDLLPDGVDALPETDPEVARLKASAAMTAAIEPAVALYEEPPTRGLEVATPWGEARLGAADWAEAFGAPDPGVPHNEAREEIWEALAVIVADRLDEDVSSGRLLRVLRQDETLVDVLGGAWPLIEPTDLVGDLWSVPAYLRRCAPWLSADQLRALQRSGPQAWTDLDLPLLDAARHRLGDPTASRRRRRHEAAVARERSRMNDAVDGLLAADADDPYGVGLLSMLRVEDGQRDLVDESALRSVDPDLLAGPFAHVVVDEAQELTDAEWLVLLRRCPSRSLTVVGDRAQARAGFAGSWPERLARVGLSAVEVAGLSINYRTPQEVMTEAEPVIRAALPDANVPTSVRRTGVPVEHGSADQLDGVLGGWLAEHAEGVACVIARDEAAGTITVTSPRVRVLTPLLAKGLEFDLVVLLDPERLGAVDRYVAMTRATQRLVLLTTRAVGPDRA